MRAITAREVDKARLAWSREQQQGSEHHTTGHSGSVNYHCAAITHSSMHTQCENRCDANEAIVLSPS